jgi:hypothetical protein
MKLNIKILYDSLADLSEKRCKAIHFWVTLDNEKDHSEKKLCGAII